MDIRKIKNLIFDFGGVLVDLDKARCLEAFACLGFTQVSSMIDAYCQQGLFGQLEDGTVTPEDFCRQLCGQTGIQRYGRHGTSFWWVFPCGSCRHWWSCASITPSICSVTPTRCIGNMPWPTSFPIISGGSRTISTASSSPTNCIR